MSTKLYNLSAVLLKNGMTAFFVAALLILAPAVTQAQITLGVTFGTSQNDGTPCVGKGVCKETSVRDHDTNIYANPEAVSATFQISPNNSNVLMMSFLLSELKSKQPDQVAYFTNGNGSYIFDVAYSLTSSQITSLTGFPSNVSYISSSANSTVVINGDIVTDYITLSAN